MYINATCMQQSETRATVDVRITYNTNEDDQLYRVTMDKITGFTTVHHDGETKTTRVGFQDPDDKAELEERAVLAAICFPTAK